MQMAESRRGCAHLACAAVARLLPNCSFTCALQQTPFLGTKIPYQELQGIDEEAL